jgi:hypothetical protein
LPGTPRPPKPISLPPIALDDIPDDVVEEELRAAAAKVAERKILRTAREAWETANKAGSWETTKAIGAALLIGRSYAMRVNGVSIPKGRGYSLTLRRWMKANGFATMSNATRKHIIVLTENAGAIERWRAGLPEQERNRIANPQHLYRRWQASLKTDHGKCLAYVKRDAITAWRRFTASMKLLPAHEAAPLCQTALAELLLI